MSLHSIGYLFREGLKSLWKNRTMSVASIGVLIACLLMTGIAGLLSLNLSATMATVEGSNTIQVVLSRDVPSFFRLFRRGSLEAKPARHWLRKAELPSRPAGGKRREIERLPIRPVCAIMTGTENRQEAAGCASGKWRSTPNWLWPPWPG